MKESLDLILILTALVLGMAAEEAMELDEEDLIDIAEEADLIQAERIIEDNTGPRGGRSGIKKGDMEEATRAVEELMLAMNLDNSEIAAELSDEGFEVKLGGDLDLFNKTNSLRQ